MTIKQMKNIAKETMNTELAYLSGDVSKGCEVRATLFAFFLSIFFLMMNIVIIVTLFARQKTNVFLTKQKGVIYEKSILY